MAKIKRYEYDGNVSYVFRCPGCKKLHIFVTKSKDGQCPTWQFNGNEDVPTFSPSLLNTDNKSERCHLFVRDGKIEYLSDCTHHLAGQTVEMEESR